MEFQQLEMFAAVVDEGSVQRAAGRVCRTAPAVSIALRKLEEEIGSPLFDKSRRYNYLLTPSGKLLYSYARRILDTRNEAVAVLKDLTNGKPGTLSIGTHESTSLYLLPLLTQAFHDSHPEIKIEILCDNSETVLGALRDRQIDLALLAIGPDEDDFEKNLIMRDELVLIAGPAHRLAGVSHLEIQNLADEFLILEGATSSLREKVIQGFKDADICPNVGVENATLETIKRMVAAGVGIGFVPLMCVREEESRGELVIVRIDGFSHERDLCLIHQKGRSLTRAAQAFLDVSLSLARSLDLYQSPKDKQGIKKMSIEGNQRRSNSKGVVVQP